MVFHHLGFISFVSVLPQFPTKFSLMRIFLRCLTQEGVSGQRDPLSPYLFILGMEVLSRMLSLEQEIGSFKGIKIFPRCPFITHLFFTDDVMIYFFQVSSSAARNIKNVINKFSLISGPDVNYSKSSIRFSPNIKDNIHQKSINAYNILK